MLSMPLSRPQHIGLGYSPCEYLPKHSHQNGRLSTLQVACSICHRRHSYGKRLKYIPRQKYIIYTLLVLESRPLT